MAQEAFKAKPPELTPPKAEIQCLCSQVKHTDEGQPRPGPIADKSYVPQLIPKDPGQEQHEDTTKTEGSETTPNVEYRCLCPQLMHADKEQEAPGPLRENNFAPCWEETTSDVWNLPETVQTHQRHLADDDFALDYYRNSAVAGTIMRPMFCARCRTVIVNLHPKETPRESSVGGLLCAACTLKAAQESEQGEITLPLGSETNRQEVKEVYSQNEPSAEAKNSCGSCERAACNDDCKARGRPAMFLTDTEGPATCKRSGLLCKICLCVSCNDLCKKYGFQSPANQQKSMSLPPSSIAAQQSENVKDDPPGKATPPVPATSPPRVSDSQPTSPTHFLKPVEKVHFNPVLQQKSEEFKKNQRPEDTTTCKVCNLQKQACKGLYEKAELVRSTYKQCKSDCPLTTQDKACSVQNMLDSNSGYQPEVCNRCGLLKRRPRRQTRHPDSPGNRGKCKKSCPKSCNKEMGVAKKDCEHCCNMDKAPVHTLAGPTRSATKSELNMALNTLQQKIRSKDALINTLKEELRQHANQETANKLIADQKYVPCDYDRFIVAEELQPTPKLYNKYGRPIHPCPCDKCGSCSGCACDVNPSPLKILYAKRLSYNLLVRWVPSESSRVIGYEVCIGGITKSRLFDRESEMAVIGYVDFSKELMVSVYALCDNGRCLPGATTNFTSRPKTA